MTPKIAQKPSRREWEVLDDFRSWLISEGKPPHDRDFLVGRTIVGESESRANAMIASKQSGQPLGTFSGLSFGSPRRGNWWIGRIDVAWNDDGEEWFAEVKSHFNVTKASQALGQVLLYSDLADQDASRLTGAKRAVVFGEVPKGRVEDGTASHGYEQVRGYAELVSKYEVTVYVEYPDRTFRLVDSSS